MNYERKGCSMAKKFSTLRAQMSPDAQARASAHTEAMLVEMGLQELRKSRQMTQVELANVLNIEQAAVSKTESRPDMYVSTLREYIRAMGGDLQLVAKFPDAEITLNGLEAAH